jgi:glycosyltransferase involved in cell wall biosynthesis
VSLTPFLGGGEIHFIKLARLLAQRFQIHALVANPETAERLRAASLNVTQLPLSSLSFAPNRYHHAFALLRSLLRSFRPDAVHLNGQGESYLVDLMHAYNVPVSVTRQTQFDTSVGLLKRWLALRGMKSVKRVICISSLIKRQLLPFLPDAKLSVIPNWLEPFPESPSLRRVPPGDHFRLLYIGRIERAKGVFELLQAMRCLSRATLDVAGDGIGMEQARAMSADLPVRFHGFKPDCAAFYRDADLLVFPSWSEGQGLVPMEAMSYGLPCLVSNIGAVLETTRAEECAEVFQVGDAEDLARKINFLRDHPGRLQELSAAGLKRVRSTYAIENVRPAYFRLFDELTGMGRSEQSRLQ